MEHSPLNCLVSLAAAETLRADWHLGTCVQTGNPVVPQEQPLVGSKGAKEVELLAQDQL